MTSENNVKASLTRKIIKFQPLIELMFNLDIKLANNLIKSTMM